MLGNAKSSNFLGGSVVCAFISCAISVAISRSQAAASGATDRPLPQLSIRPSPDGAFFVQNGGIPIRLQGFNYIRLRNGDHSTFEAATDRTTADYDPNAAEAMFSALEVHGFNLVRVFITGRRPDNPGIAGNLEATTGVYMPYMTNVIDFLHRARNHHLYVFPNLIGLPISRSYQGLLGHEHSQPNSLYFTPEGIAARCQYISDFVEYLMAHDRTSLSTLLAIECDNELSVYSNQWPFTVTTGTLTMPNRKAYNMTLLPDRRALMDEGLAYYHDRISSTVKRVAPELMVAEGIFTNEAVGKSAAHEDGIWPAASTDNRYPPDLISLGRSSLDFLDIHFYRTRRTDLAACFSSNMCSSSLDRPEMIQIRKQKPVILGEFGAFRSVEKDMTEVVPDMLKIRDLSNAAGLKGFLFWTYDTAEQPELFHATEADGVLLKTLGQ